MSDKPEKTRKYFSYDPEGNGYCTHETEQAAKDEALESIQHEREYAIDDGWGDNVGHICWGEIVQSASEVPIDKTAMCDENREYIDYDLVSLDKQTNTEQADLAKPSEWISGLKDHEIQELVNLLTARLSPVARVQCLREMIHGELVPYLEKKGLRIDKP